MTLVHTYPDVVSTPEADPQRLFHELNNKLGIILANAELLESKLTNPGERARAEQVVVSVLEAIRIAKSIRKKCQFTDN